MRQKLGQHFLANLAILKRIASYADVKENDVVIEIGPGHGELTEHIIHGASRHAGIKIILIEKDKSLVVRLQTKFASPLKSGVVDIFGDDALTLLPQIIDGLAKTKQSYKIVGNIPYYITGFLFRVISELAHKPSRCIFLIQKEVAERASARPPHMNLLAASVQYWADATMLDLVPRDSFSPSPDVDSAVIQLVTKHSAPVTPSDRYFECVKTLFKQPRKNLLNNLKGNTAFAKLSPQDAQKIFESIGHKPTDRPQDMHIESILLLAHLLYNE